MNNSDTTIQNIENWNISFNTATGKALHITLCGAFFKNLNLSSNK